VACKHITKAQRTHAVTLFVQNYIRYYRTAEKYDRDRDKAAAAALIVEEEKVAAAAAAAFPSTAAAAAALPAKEGLNLSVGVEYTADGWSDDDSMEEEDVEGEEEEEEDLSDGEVTAIAMAALKNWRRVKVDWGRYYPEHFPPTVVEPVAVEGSGAAAAPAPQPAAPAPPQALDIFEDLMPLDPGRVYRDLVKSDPKQEKYGLIPQMAGGSKGCISFLPSQSFCERVNSIAKDVMTDAHTLMDDEELEMLVTLRMNRKFMEYMRGKYNHLSLQQFGKTLVR